MKLSTRVLYGLKAVVELALRGAYDGSAVNSVPVSQVSKRQGIPEQYLRQLFARLRRARIVSAERGRSGGYFLARLPERISAMDVMEALGERIEPVFCVRKPKECRRAPECPTHPLWCRLADIMKEALSAMTVAQLAERCPGRGRGRGRAALPRGYMFHI